MRCLKLPSLLRLLLAPFLAGFAYIDEPATAAAEPGAPEAPEATPAEPASGSTLDAINQAIADVSATAAPKPADPPAPAESPAGTPAMPAAAVPAADTPKPPEGEKPAGPTDDELTAPLEGLKGRTKERFEQLSGRLKERTAEIEDLRSQVETLTQQAQAVPQAQEAVSTLQELHGAMTDAGVGGDELANFLNYARAVRSGDFKSAAQVLIGQLRPMLPYVHGQIDLAGALDPLSDFPDLQQAVAQAQITAEHAAELANGRRLRQQAMQASQQSRQQQEATQGAERAKAAGLQELAGLERQLASSDADYRRIAPELVKAIPTICQQYPPHLWAAAVKERYGLLKQYMPAATPAVPAAPATPAPIRPGGAHSSIPAKLSTANIVDMVANGELT